MAGEKSRLKDGHTVYAGGPWGGVAVRRELENYKFEGTFHRAGKLTRKRVDLPPLTHDIPKRMPVDPNRYLRYPVVKGRKMPVTVTLWKGHYELRELMLDVKGEETSFGERYVWIEDEMLSVKRAILTIDGRWIEWDDKIEEHWKRGHWLT